ncbi:MAG: hypothetical protein IPJ32_12625 [Sphingobacteriaceae bacterium]|nr:hypothetical protein [Sphingobacteriaceae bacterium]
MVPDDLFILYFYNKTTPETYLIPKDFQGKFRVIYGEQCGQDPKEENGRRVLEIPSSGILIIKPKFEAGIVNNEYYFIDKDGHRTKTQELFKGTGFDESKIGVFLDGTGNIGGQMPDGSLSSESPLAIHFSDYYVCKNDSDQYGNSKIESRFDSLTHAQVDQCRRKD